MDQTGKSTTARYLLIFEGIVVLLFAILLLIISYKGGGNISNLTGHTIFATVTYFSYYLIVISALLLAAAFKPTNCVIKLLLPLMGLSVLLGIGMFASTVSGFDDLFSKLSKHQMDFDSARKTDSHLTAMCFIIFFLLFFLIVASIQLAVALYYRAAQTDPNFGGVPFRSTIAVDYTPGQAFARPIFAHDRMWRFPHQW